MLLKVTTILILSDSLISMRKRSFKNGNPNIKNRIAYLTTFFFSTRTYIANGKIARKSDIED